MNKKIFVTFILLSLMVSSSAQALTVSSILKIKKDLETELVQLKGKQAAAVIMSKTDVPRDPLQSTINLQKEVEKIKASTGKVAGVSVTNPSYVGNYNFGTKTLSSGSTGPAVIELQRFLGINPTNGYFGPMTKSKLIEWQKSAGVDPVGIFGPSSRAKAYKYIKSITI